MSVDYAAGLSEYDDLGVCGLDEVYDSIGAVREKVKLLANWLRQFNGSCVVHVGAGLSTSAGIPDFRGKRGVWTKLCQTKQQTSAQESTDSKIKREDVEDKQDDNDDKIKPFDETEPTYSHCVLKQLCDLGYIKHIVSQNVDGLFLKSNLSRKYISELHGNFYLDECTKCRSRFIRSTASRTMRLQKSSIRCPRNKPMETTSRATCLGFLRDTILDWESPIPYNELRVAQRESKRNKLHLCIGTSLQLRPSKDLVCDPTRNKSCKLVVINLQPIQLNSKADLVINYYADEVMKYLVQELAIEVPPYSSTEDPTKNPDSIGTMWQKS